MTFYVDLPAAVLKQTENEYATAGQSSFLQIGLRYVFVAHRRLFRAIRTYKPSLLSHQGT